MKNSIFNFKIAKQFKIYFLLFVFLIVIVFCSKNFALVANGQEKIIFLHHSTGNNVYREGNVAGWIASYNAQNGVSYQIDERMYPDSRQGAYPAWDNYPYDYWNLWVNGKCSKTNPAIECLDSLAQKYDMIVFKHCFPGSNILADAGNTSTGSNRKSLENYKLQYRVLRDLMDNYPDNEFMIWTLSPAPSFSGIPSANVVRAKEFVNWIKNDFLTEDGKKHSNIHIFDWWGIAADNNNYLKAQYERPGKNDPHPNVAANQYAGPLFAQAMVDVLNSINRAPVIGGGRENTDDGGASKSAEYEEDETNRADELAQIKERANVILSDKFSDILKELKETKSSSREQQIKTKYLQKLIKNTNIAQNMEEALNNFVTYGVDENTKNLGAGERAAVINSYREAFRKLPETKDELVDAIKIANGRWPSLTSLAAEKRAKEIFRKIYKRIVDMNNGRDNAAITIMAYGLRQKAENRKLESEKKGITIFKGIYNKNPETTEEWNIMQAITYSGAVREKDTDSDFLPDGREKVLGTNPNKADSDGDGHVDGIEVENGYDPLVGASTSNEITTSKKWKPGHYMLQDKTWTVQELDEEVSKLDEYIKGIQIGAWWRDLEPEKGVYDFTDIKERLTVAKKYNKQVFVQVMDRIFATTGRPIPDYLYSSEYNGGAESFTGSTGSIAKFWEPAVGERFNLLIQAIGKEFDNNPNFEGINFDESSLPFDTKKAAGYTDQKFLDAMKLRIDNAIESFPNSVIIQYMNYYPPNLVELYDYIYKAGAGIGGPDLVPDEGRFPEKPRIPAYDYYPQYAGKMPLGTAVQSEEFLDPEWLEEFCGAYSDLNVNLCQKVNGHYLRKKGDFTLNSFWDMGLNTLKLNYIFWEVVDGVSYKYTWEDVKFYITEKKGKINEIRPENYKN